MCICYQCGRLVARYPGGKMIVHKLGQAMCWGSQKAPRDFMYPFRGGTYYAAVRGKEKTSEDQG